MFLELMQSEKKKAGGGGKNFGERLEIVKGFFGIQYVRRQNCKSIRLISAILKIRILSANCEVKCIWKS
jgi:hypothetical protein